MMRKGKYSQVLYFLLGCIIVIFFIFLRQLFQTTTIFISLVLDVLSAAMLVIAVITLIGHNTPGLFKRSRYSQEQHQVLRPPASSVTPQQAPLTEGEVANSQ